LKLFTFLPLDKIYEVMEEHRKLPEKRIAQHILAQEFLHLAHGSTVAKETAELHHTRAAERKTINISGLLQQKSQEVEEAVRRSSFPEYMRKPPSSKLLTGIEKVPETVSVTKQFLEENSFPAVLQHVGLVNSRSEGHRLITNKGAYVACDSSSHGMEPDHLTWRPIISPIKGAPASHVKWEGESGLLVLRSGKWNVKIVRVYSASDAICLDGGTVNELK
jgi:tyrosyl-tRNA synthetase